MRNAATYMIDLLAVCEKLEAASLWPELVKSIRILAAAQRSKIELERAANFMHLLDLEMSMPVDHRISNFSTDSRTAFFSAAVMAYFRATDTKAHVAHWQGPKGVTKESKRAHERICKLRNNVIGHHGDGEDASGNPVAKYGLAARGQDGMVQTVFPYTNRIVQPQYLADLTHLLKTIYPRTAERVAVLDKKMGDLTQEALDDPRVAHIWRTSPFDPDKFFDGDQAMIDGVRRSRGLGFSARSQPPIVHPPVQPPGEE